MRPHRGHGAARAQDGGGGRQNHEVWQVVGKVFLKDLWPSGKKKHPIESDVALLWYPLVAEHGHSEDLRFLLIK